MKKSKVLATMLVTAAAVLASSCGPVSTVVDGGGGNQAPVAQNGAFTVDQDTVLTDTLTATDADGDTLTFAKASDPAHGVLALGTDGGFTYTPSAGYNGADSFTFTVSDGKVNSNVATATIDVQAAVVDPAAPSGLQATWVSDGDIGLQWVDNSPDEQGFRIERKANNEAVFSQLVVALGNIAYHDLSVAANGRYSYRVVAVRAAGDTGPSNVATIFTTPAAPTSLSAAQVADNAVNLAWTDNAAFETGYRVDRATDGVNFATIAALPANAGTYTDSLLQMGTTYTWKIVAVRGGREGVGETALTIIPGSGPQWALPDTGQILCYGGSGAIACPSAGQAYFGQDAQYGINTLVLTNNGDGTVTDGVTGLMWQAQDSGSTYTWVNALAYCEGLSLAGQSDWRLPTLDELQSIVDYSRVSPAIDTLVFPGAALYGYWSSSSYALNSYAAWQVYFTYGNVYDYDKANNFYARCVRQ
jgi:hypothetical protein